MPTISGNNTTGVSTTADGELVFVTLTGSVVLGSDAIVSTHADVSFAINGTVISSNENGMNLSGSGVIHNDGLIMGVSGISMSSNGYDLFNGGAVTGSADSAIVFSHVTGTNRIYNSGTINSTSIAIEVTGAGALYVYNTGQIVGHISFNSGDDLYDGRGGTVNGYINGEDGDDTYNVDDAQTVILETANHGYDTLYIGSNYHLANTNEIEAIILTGIGNFRLIGNLNANELLGNNGDNVIRGYGGDDTIDGAYGADKLYGGSGIDLLSYENSTEGVTVDLGAATCSGGDAEGDTITGFEWLEGSSENDKLYGTTGSNHLTGGDGKDTLDGRGGDDTLEGGDGDDTFIIGDDEAEAIETASNGIDLVKASITWALDDIYEVENLTLTGSSAINATGNALDNVLTGNSGKNTLKGLDGDDALIGGGGNDTLKGGSGADTFLFKAGWAADTISDFSVAEDIIDLYAIVDDIKSFSDLKNNHATNVGDDVVIEDSDGNTITIRDVQIADLSASNFNFINA